MPYPFGSGIGVVGEYQAAATKAGQKFNYTAMEGYIAATVISEAIRRMARPTREGLVAALEGMSAYNAGGFNVGFRPNKHIGSSFVELSMLTSDGRVKR
jgi:ABC-type branched-subunit amino acid transport system substrate-binding protein